MTAGGWIVMSVAISGMTALLVWCLYKVLSTPGATKHIHSPVDIEPEDEED